MSISKCGAFDRTAVHVILECPLHRSPGGYQGLQAQRYGFLLSYSNTLAA